MTRLGVQAEQSRSRYSKQQLRARRRISAYAQLLLLVRLAPTAGLLPFSFANLFGVCGQSRCEPCCSLVGCRWPYEPCGRLCAHVVLASLCTLDDASKRSVCACLLQELLKKLQELLKKLQTVLMGLRPAAILTDDMYYIQLGETTCAANPSHFPTRLIRI